MSVGDASGLPLIRGEVAPGFEPVRRAFIENFTHRGELGGACCVYRHGERVVDLWGGVRDRATGTPWQADTMVLVHSATKGLAAMTAALAQSRGWLDYDERVCTYWPAFAQAGKERVTIRQLLAHQAGLHAFDEPVDHAVIADPARLAGVMERQRPAWEPGTRQAYHAISLGFYLGEIMRRVDPRHRSLGQFFHEEIASPLGLDFYIRLPPDIPNARLAPLESPGMLAMFLTLPLRLQIDLLRRRSPFHRAMIANPGTVLSYDPEHIYTRDFEVPSGGGVGSARGIARAYSAFAACDGDLGLKQETIDLLMAPARPPTHGFYDAVMRGEAQFSLGFMKPSPQWPFGHDGAFGAPGAGGSLGYADPRTGIAYAYVTNRMGTALTGDPRDLALRDALRSLA